MKIIYALISIILLINTAFSQVAIEWQKCFGGSDTDAGNYLELTNDGGYIVAGFSTINDGDVSVNYGFEDAWIIKLDTFGIIQWEKSYGGSGSDVAYSITQTIDGGYIFCGNSYSNDFDVTFNYGYSDYWIVKIDSVGNIQWQKSYGGSESETANDIIETSDGGYIVAGQTESSDGLITGFKGGVDFWIVKIDNNGNLQWQKSLGGSLHDRAWSVIEVLGGYLITGETRSINGDVSGNIGLFDGWIVKLDTNGTLQWQKCIGGSAGDFIISIIQTIDGGYIGAGRSNSNDGDVSGNHGGLDQWIVKMDSVGTIQWQVCLGGSNEEGASSIQETVDGGYIVTGGSNSNDGDLLINNGDFDYWVVKLNNQGIIQWQKSLGGSLFDYSSTIKQTNNGGFIIVGSSDSNDGDVSGNHGNGDFWVVKLSNPNSIESIMDNFTFSLYPNPTKGEINISFTLNEASHVKIELFNSLGQIVKTIADKKLNSGENKISFSTEDIPKGIYHLKFSVNEKTAAKKVVKM